MKRMSFMLTPTQFLNGTKTVTRRMGWRTLKPGDRLLAVSKCMGLKRGEKPVIYGPFEVVSLTREPLSAITQDDVTREGFPDMTREEFIAFFCKSHKGCTPETEVSRIEFRKERTEESNG